jgi:L-malate glycosyltransferase
VKIVLLGPASVIHTRRWFYGLCALGHEVTLISQHRYEHLACPPTGSIRYLPHTGSKGYFLNVPALRALLTSIKPDLVNAHYASGYGTLASLVHFRPTVISVWGSDVYDFPYEFPPVKMWLMRWILNRCDRVASTSRVMAAQVRKLTPGIKHIDITPFGVDTGVFAPIAGVRDDHYITIGTVKTLDPKYGIDSLIRAFARARHDSEVATAGLCTKLRLVLVGDGSQRLKLSDLVRELGIDGCTTFVGAVEHAQVPQILNQFDIYVAVSRLDSESFGVAVIEASSCAVPVVVSDKGGLPEVVESNVTGFVAPADDVAEIAQHLKSLILDNSLRQKMGAAGRQRIIDHYEWRTCIETMVACYSAVIDGYRAEQQSIGKRS